MIGKPGKLTLSDVPELMPYETFLTLLLSQKFICGSGGPRHSLNSAGIGSAVHYVGAPRGHAEA